MFGQPTFQNQQERRKKKKLKTKKRISATSSNADPSKR
jgi:hypothetical protein